jgi:winged helix DNA-binding protein
LTALTWADARERRLARSHLVTQAPKSRLIDVVRKVCGLQAQLLSAAELALSARVAEVTQESVRVALWEEKTLVRAWTVRGTIHVIPAEDLPLWMAALGTRRYWESKEWLEREQLTAKEASAIFDTVHDVLGDTGSTRAQIADAVVTRLGTKFRPKIVSMWGELLAPLMYMGKMCFGPSVGANVTFVRADKWVRKWPRLDPEEARRELVRRFLRAYGPTTLDGIARWFGMKPAAFRPLLRSLEPEAVEVTIEGRKGWELSRERRVPRRASSSVRLLAQYDCYVIGSHPRDTITHEAARTQIRSYKRGQWEGVVGVPVLLVDGMVSGVWERRERGGRIEIGVRPSIKLTAAQQRGVAAEVARIGRFFGREATLT